MFFCPYLVGPTFGSVIVFAMFICHWSTVAACNNLAMYKIAIDSNVKHHSDIPILNVSSLLMVDVSE